MWLSAFLQIIFVKDVIFWKLFNLNLQHMRSCGNFGVFFALTFCKFHRSTLFSVFNCLCLQFLCLKLSNLKFKQARFSTNQHDQAQAGQDSRLRPSPDCGKQYLLLNKLKT